jgi:hypothetical protein
MHAVRGKIFILTCLIIAPEALFSIFLKRISIYLKKIRNTVIDEMELKVRLNCNSSPLIL